MNSRLELSVVVSTFERPEHLRRCLASLARQTLDRQRYEIIIADDGSRDETRQVVERFRERSDVSLVFCTQEHQGFQKARAVNRALQHVRSSYVVLTDGDCIFPPNHLDIHLSVRREKIVWAGNSVWLSRDTSEQIDEASVLSGRWRALVPQRLPRTQAMAHRKARLYETIGHPTKPKLIGNNIGLWRDQLVSINGFDQSFRGWGCEDDDLGLRLRLQGNRVRSLLGHTHAFHLWHPPHETKPSKWSEGLNVRHFQRPLLLSHCLDGMTTKRLEHVGVRVLSERSFQDAAQRLRRRFATANPPRVEIEVLFWPSPSVGFSGEAECNVLVGRELSGIPRGLRKKVGLHIELGDELTDPSEIAEYVLAELSRGLGINASSEMNEASVHISLHRITVPNPLSIAS